MSRVEKENANFMVAFGADSTTGSYLQVWHQPHEMEDGAFIRIDNLGVAVEDDRPIATEDIIGASAWRYLMNIKERYQFARGHGNPAPNVDADTIAVFLAKLGFPGCGKEVRAALD